MKLTPKICLDWYLEDGSLCKSGSNINLCTNGFTKKEVEFLIEILWRDLKIKATINKSGKNKAGIQKWVIYISRIEARKFLDQIGLCPVSCYLYKWDWKENKNELRKKIYLKKIKPFVLQGLTDWEICKLTGICHPTVKKYRELLI